MAAKTRFEIILNDKTNLQQALNKLNDECDFTINQVQDQISGLINSTGIENVDISDKAEFTKAINSLITTKGNILKLKMDIYKTCAEILKFNGNTEMALKETKGTMGFDIKYLQKKCDPKPNNEDSDKVIYSI